MCVENDVLLLPLTCRTRCCVPQVDEFVFSTLLAWMREDGEFPVSKYASAAAPASAGAGAGGKATEVAAFAGAGLPHALAETFLPDVSGAAAAGGDTSYGALRAGGSVGAVAGNTAAAPAGGAGPAAM